MPPSACVLPSLRRRLAVCGMIAAAALLAPAPATTLTVPADHWRIELGGGAGTIGAADDPSSGGVACTLRDALAAASTALPTFGCAVVEVGSPDATSPAVLPLPAGPYTYTLTLGQLTATGRTIYVLGGDTDTTIVQAAASRGTANSRVFFADADDLILYRLTVRHGNVTGEGGGALASNGAMLVVDECTIADNDATSDGGGLATDGEPIVVRRSTVSGNVSGGQGGGVNHHFDIFASVISGNTAGVSGGGLFSNATSDLEDSLVEGNSAPLGGGWRNRASDRVVGNAFVGNHATAGNGGGMAADDTTVNVNDCTFSGNTATGSGGGLVVEGGGGTTLFNVTVTGNTADAGGGVASDGTSLEYANSIVSGNVGVGDDPDCTGEGAGASLGYNLLGAECSAGGTGDVVGGTLGLAPLADNGGKTSLPDGSRVPTHEVLPGSSAIDAGNPGGCMGADDSGPIPLPVDQRGFPRTDGDGDTVVRCDMGAYELGGEDIFADGFESGDTDAWSVTGPP